MVVRFLKKLLDVLSTLAVVVLDFLSLKWLKNKIKDRIIAHRKHKVVFADTRELVDDYLKEQVGSKESISMDDLEALCDKSPFVIADYDVESDELMDWEGIKSESDGIDVKIKNKVKEERGILVFEG